MYWNVMNTLHIYIYLYTLRFNVYVCIYSTLDSPIRMQRFPPVGLVDLSKTDERNVICECITTVDGWNLAPPGMYKTL